MNNSSDAKNLLQRAQEQIGRLSPDYLTQIALYFAGALLTGFVIKRLGRSVLVLAVATALTIWFLNYTHIISFDMLKLKKLLGLSSNFNTDTLLEQVTSWIKENPLFALAVIIGLLFGIQLG